MLSDDRLKNGWNYRNCCFLLKKNRLLRVLLPEELRTLEELLSLTSGTRCSTAATAGRACIALRFTTAIGTRTATVSTRAATIT